MARERVFRIERYYGIPGPGKDPRRFEAEQLSLKLVADIFAQRGFKIERGGQPDPNNLEVGMGIFTAPVEYINRRDRYIADQTKVEMPLEYLERDEILNGREPIVAKRFDAHRGEEKYLLTTLDDREKFVAIAFARSDVLKSIAQIQDPKEQQRRYAELLDKVRKREFDLRIFNEFTHEFNVERYVETPSDRYTSFRVLAGADGEVKYALLLYSSNKKTDPVPLPNPQKFKGYDSLFLDPNSVLHIKSPKVVSNFAQREASGGKINLTRLLRHRDLIRSLPEEEKDILRAHGFNVDEPDKFALPKGLEEKSQRIGQFMRLAYPYVGVDFLLGKDKKLYFIEANINPSVTPDNLVDMQQVTGSLEARKALFESVAGNMQ